MLRPSVACLCHQHSGSLLALLPLVSVLGPPSVWWAWSTLQQLCDQCAVGLSQVPEHLSFVKPILTVALECAGGASSGVVLDKEGSRVVTSKSGAPAARILQQAEPGEPPSLAERGSKSAGRPAVISEDSSSRAHRISSARRTHEHARERPASGGRRTEVSLASGDSARESKRQSDLEPRETLREQTSAHTRDDAGSGRPSDDQGRGSEALAEQDGTQGTSQKHGLEHDGAVKYRGDVDDEDVGRRKDLVPPIGESEGLSSAKAPRSSDAAALEASLGPAADVVEDGGSKKEKKRKHKKEKKEKKERKKRMRREKEGALLVPGPVGPLCVIEASESDATIRSCCCS